MTIQQRAGVERDAVERDPAAEVREASIVAGLPISGRVLQVNVSLGGVPKHSVPEAQVGWLGLEGDRHRSDTVHGGPHRAVCLFGIEQINRVADEGHPIEPGSVGENLTIAGIELTLLAPGTRLAVGDEVILEISAPANPCDTIIGAFHDGRSGRISILTHPMDSRMYARVLTPGRVRPTDPIRVLSPEPGSLAETHRRLDRLDHVGGAADVAIWEAARRAGHDVRIVDDGDLQLVAAPSLPGRTFNRALGYRLLPNLLDRMLDFFRHHGVVGWVSAEDAPWPGAEPASAYMLLVADPTAVAALPPPDMRGLEIRAIEADEARAWGQRLVEWSGIDEVIGRAWTELSPYLAATRGHTLLIATIDGKAAAVSGLFSRTRIGILRTTAVAPAFRGRGIQRALIVHRARLALDHGCTTLHASANDDSISLLNLRAMGMEPIWHRRAYRFDPLSSPSLGSPSGIAPA